LKPTDQVPTGSLKISRSVIETVARTAAREIDGVHGFCFAPADIKGMISHRQMPKPVRITLADGIAQIELHLILKEGARIPSVCERVQTTVKEAVQSMTGIAVSRVDVVVDGVMLLKAVANVKE
jgi:uncharacterized alkaline shock family protein YloU